MTNSKSKIIVGAVMCNTPPLEVTSPPESIDTHYWRVTAAEGKIAEDGTILPYLQVDQFDHRQPFDKNAFDAAQMYIYFRRDAGAMRSALINALTLAFNANLRYGMTVNGEYPHFRVNIDPHALGEVYGKQATH